MLILLETNGRTNKHLSENYHRMDVYIYMVKYISENEVTSHY